MNSDIVWSGKAACVQECHGNRTTLQRPGKHHILTLGMKANVVLWLREGGRKESSVSRLTASLPYLVLKYVVELMSLPCLPSGSWFIAITSLREKAVREEVREKVVREKAVRGGK